MLQVLHSKAWHRSWTSAISCKTSCIWMSNVSPLLTISSKCLADSWFSPSNFFKLANWNETNITWNYRNDTCYIMYNALDFTLILYFARGRHIVNKSNVFCYFFRPGNHIATIFGVYYLSTCKVVQCFSYFGHYSIKSLNVSNKF